MRILLFLLPLFLLGCMRLASPEGRHEGQQTQSLNIPLSDIINDKAIDEAADRASEKSAEKSSLKTAATVSANIETKMKSVQDNVTGLVTAKIDEIGKLVDISAKIENKMNADIRSEMSNVMKAVIDINTKFESNISVKTDLKALSDNVLHMQAMIDGIGQVGINNKSDVNKVMETMQQEFKAGRDVYSNSFPKEAVDIMIAQMKYQSETNSIEQRYQYLTIVAVLVALKAIILGISVYIYKNARLREENNNKLLMQAVGELDPIKASAITGKM